MQGVTIAVPRDVRLADAETAPFYGTAYINVIHAAFDAYIVPVPRTPVAPLTIIPATSLAGKEVLHLFSERLRQELCDATMPEDMRVLNLTHCATVVSHARLVAPIDSLPWLARLTAWHRT